MVAKRLESRYYPGKRSRDRLKIKNVRHQEVPVGGWRPGKGRRSTMIGSLPAGIPDDRGLEYAGNVGTGFTEGMLRDLTARLRPLERESSPFDTEVPHAHAPDAHWMRPELVGKGVSSERTANECSATPAGAASGPTSGPRAYTAKPDPTARRQRHARRREGRAAA
jgi:bifunctional non-homologous end joining protein LigD